MPRWLRFKDLQARGLVKSRPQLKNLQEKFGFPAGRLIGPNTRAWDLQAEVEPWEASRPTDKRPTPRSPGRPRKAAEHGAEADA
jgi:hypothetical protein